MNQILYTGNKNSGAMELKKVIKIFVIGILIFAIGCLAEGSYGVVKEIQEEANKIVDPNVTIEQIEDIVQIQIEHRRAIDKIVYILNDGEEVVLQGKGKKDITEQIVMPEGENTLNIRIIDSKGHEVSYNNTYFVEKIDRTNPEIELLVEDAKVKIVAKDETALSHISYYWNLEDETILEAREESPNQIEEKLTILKGQNVLTVIAVDLAGNETKVEQTYIGATKPTIETFVENDYLVIKVNDEDSIKKIEYTHNGEEYSTDKDNLGIVLNMKEAYCRQDLVSGKNTFSIRAYNASGLVTEKTLEIDF